MLADPPLSLSEAQAGGLTRIRLACPKCGAATIRSADCASALAATPA
jgi:hypothetical protein